MFTLEQIQSTHAKVKSGVDFPKYVRDMKALGVTSYEHYVSDGHIAYKGQDNFSIESNAKWPAKEIASPASAQNLEHNLKVHQLGKTDYPTFCQQSANAGVEKWIVDMVKMKCIYFDKDGNEMLAEDIPAVS
jgi:uncharacterized protein YbcV (DUF1398 family)